MRRFAEMLLFPWRLSTDIASARWTWLRLPPLILSGSLAGVATRSRRVREGSRQRHGIVDRGGVCALVLVACLIVVPLAAIFGSQFPDVVKSVLIDRIFPNGVPGVAGAEAARDTAPPFVATTQPPGWQANTAGPGGGVATQPATGNSPAWTGAAVEPAVAWNQSPGQVRPAAGEGLPGGQAGGAERLGVAVPVDAPESSCQPESRAECQCGVGFGQPAQSQCTFDCRPRSLHLDGAPLAGVRGDLLFAGDVGKRQRILSLSLQNGDRQQSHAHSAIRGHRHRSLAGDGTRGGAGRGLAHGRLP